MRSVRRARDRAGAALAVLALAALTCGTTSSPDQVPSDPRFALLAVDVSGHPARWEACRTVRVRVNHADPRAPADADALVEQALDRLAAATGLRFALLGATTYVPYTHDARPPDADLVVAWSDAATVPALAGDVAGQGGAVWTTTQRASTITQAQVVLDVEEHLHPGFAPGRSVGTALLHELGHAVGLTHVEDPTQVMASGLTARSRPAYQPGDLAGLAVVGAPGRC